MKLIVPSKFGLQNIRRRAPTCLRDEDVQGQAVFRLSSGRRMLEKVTGVGGTGSRPSCPFIKRIVERQLRSSRLWAFGRGSSLLQVATRRCLVYERRNGVHEAPFCGLVIGLSRLRSPSFWHHAVSLTTKRCITQTVYCVHRSQFRIGKAYFYTRNCDATVKGKFASG